MISTRQESLLATIINEYVDSAKPISSGELVKHDDFDLSPATIRNDMVALGDAGYLVQPHTSAGRIPTEKAWRWYIKNWLEDGRVSKRDQTQLDSVVSKYSHRQDELMRNLAKTMAELIAETVIVGFAKNDVYYTGVSNLFSQPEFEQLDSIQHLSRVIDHLDEVMRKVFDEVSDEIKVMVGKDNPFSQDCGVIVTRYTLSRQPSGVISILGPIRQDYHENVAVIRYAQNLLHNI